MLGITRPGPICGRAIQRGHRMNDSQCFSNRRRLPAALLPLLLILGAAGPVLAVDGVIEINQASTGGGLNIDQPGSYRLTSDLQPPPGFDSIRITADHVTLDLNGFSIVGDPGSAIADGISVTASDVEVRNGTIHSFSRHGVFAPSFFHFVRVIGVRAMGNTFSGIELQGVGNTVDGCTAMNNGQFGIRAEDGSIIMNSVARQNGLVGLVMDPTTGYRSNIVTENNGGNALPQTAGGIQLGSNICGTDLVCP